MSALHPCPSCRRHVRESDCPFCGATAVRREPIDLGLGRVSRAMVFGAALAAGACGGKQKQQEPPPVQDHPCAMAGPEEIARLQKAVEQAQNEEEKKQAEENLEQAKTTPMCAPYGAPPARRRVV